MPKKSKTSKSLAKRVNKIEKQIQNVSQKSFKDNTSLLTNHLNVGQIANDPFNMNGIQLVASNLSATQIGERIGSKIVVYNIMIRGSIKQTSVIQTNRFTRVRLILFKLGGLTASPPISNNPLPSDILDIPSSSNVLKTEAFYKKYSDITYRVEWDKTFMLGNTLAAQSQGSLDKIYTNSNFPPVRYFEKMFRFKSGLPVEYDDAGNIRTNQYRLLVISQNDDGTDTSNATVEWNSRINYEM